MPDDDAPRRSSTSADRLDEVVAGYLRAIESGETPSQDELLTRHPDLAEELREFFADYERMDRLAQPLFEPTHIQRATIDMPGEATAALGTVIGPYKLLQQIGAGGMGVVYMAEQAAPVRRKLALKIIKPGMDTREVIARFEAERQALALMDHPNIARVFDAGATEAGRPYFVMELVRGVPITDYCDQHNLPVHERLELFITVCHAVQHAHQKGIIHRDIKPTNVLVTLHDSRPVPKVIDFGVAKAIGQQLTDKTLFTQFAQMVGTPLYMSPEQAQMSGQDVDTRGDIYSLGVMLYELLTGTTPFERGRMKQAALEEIRRMIREEDPPSPSTRLSSTAGKTQTAVAAHRRVDPRGLSRLVRGDLDWIVMKALEKDRDRRYETANSFAADLGRYLSDEPVEACPPSAWYRVRKFARRNKGAVLATSVILVCLIGGIIGTTLGLVEARLQERIAVAETVEKETARAAEARQRQQAEDQRDRALKAEARAEANFRQAREAVDDMYTQVAEKWLARQPHMEAVQREFLQKALRFYEQFAQEAGSDPATRFESARAYRRVAEIQYRLGARVQAEPAGKRALDLLEKLAEEFPGVPEYRQDLADALHKMGDLLGSAGRNPEMEIRRALALQEKLVVDFPAVPDYRRDLGRGYWYLGRLLGSLRQRAEQENAYRSALAIQSRLVAEFPSVPEYRQQLAQSYLGFGGTLRYQGRPQEDRNALQEAAAILEKLVDEYPTIPEYRNYLAGAYYWLANLLPSQAAEQSIRKALILQEKLATDFPGHTDYRYDLFRSLESQGAQWQSAERTTEAEQAFRRAVEIGEKLTAESPTVHYYRSRLAGVCSRLGSVLRSTGKLAEAEAQYQRSIRLYEHLIAEFPDATDMRQRVVQSYQGLAQLLVSTGSQQEAEKVYRQAVALSEELVNDLPASALAHNALAWMLATSLDPKFRDPGRAVQLAKKAVELKPGNGYCWNTLGVAHYRAGEWKDSIDALKKSDELLKGELSFNAFFLAMAHWQLGEKDEARTWYDQAVEWMEMNKPQDEELGRFREEAAELLGVKADNPSDRGRRIPGDQEPGNY